MKVLRTLIAPLALSAMAASTAWAAGVDNNNDFNTAKFRMPARSASTDVDAAIYNPAGLLKLDDGFYALLSNAVISTGFQHKLSDGTEFDGGALTPIFPAAVLVYKLKDFVGYFNFTLPGGGGSVTYDDGSLSTYSQANFMAQGLVATVSAGAVLDGHPTDLESKVEGSSAYMGFTLGGGYKINDMISVAAGGRFIKANVSQTMEVDMGMTGTGFPIPDFAVSITNETERAAQGYGAIVGINLTPMQGLNIGMRYEGQTRLEFENELKTNDVTVTGTGLPAVALAAMEDSIAQSLAAINPDGHKSNRDLPAMSSLGVAYNVIPSLLLAVDFNWYYNRYARWQGANDHRASNFDVTMGAEYAFMEKLKGSVGFAYARLGSTDTNFGSYENPALSSYTPGVGVQYEVMPGLKIDVAYAMPIYTSITTAGDIEVSKSRQLGAISIQYKIL